jgi:hypothetical protein
MLRGHGMGRSGWRERRREGRGEREEMRAERGRDETYNDLLYLRAAAGAAGQLRHLHCTNWLAAVLINYSQLSCMQGIGC